MRKTKLRFDEMQLLFAIKTLGKNATFSKIFEWVENDNEMQPPYAYVTICVLCDLVERKFLTVADSTDIKKVKFIVTEEGKAAYRRVLGLENQKIPGMYNPLPK